MKSVAAHDSQIDSAHVVAYSAARDDSPCTCVDRHRSRIYRTKSQSLHYSVVYVIGNKIAFIVASTNTGEKEINKQRNPIACDGFTFGKSLAKHAFHSSPSLILSRRNPSAMVAEPRHRASDSSSTPRRRLKDTAGLIDRLIEFLACIARRVITA